MIRSKVTVSVFSALVLGATAADASPTADATTDDLPTLPSAPDGSVAPPATDLTALAPRARAKHTSHPAATASATSPPGGDSAKAILSHSVLGFAVLRLPDDAIDRAELVTTREGRQVVRTYRPDSRREVAMFDAYPLADERFALGGALVLRPTQDDWVVGAGISLAANVGRKVWVRAGGGVVLARYQRLLPGVESGAELETTETRPPTEPATAVSPAVFVGVGLRF